MPYWVWSLWWNFGYAEIQSHQCKSSTEPGSGQQFPDGTGLVSPSPGPVTSLWNLLSIKTPSTPGPATTISGVACQLGPFSCSCLLESVFHTAPGLVLYSTYLGKSFSGFWPHSAHSSSWPASWTSSPVFPLHARLQLACILGSFSMPFLCLAFPLDLCMPCSFLTLRPEFQYWLRPSLTIRSKIFSRISLLSFYFLSTLLSFLVCFLILLLLRGHKLH